MPIRLFSVILVSKVFFFLLPPTSSAKDHPHLFFDSKGMKALRERALNNPRLNKIWLQFKTDQVDEAMKVEVQNGDFSDVSLGREIGDALATLTIAYIVLEGKKYASKAEEMMLALARRSNWSGNRLVKAHISMGVAFCWDVMYDRFSNSTRELILTGVERNANNTLYSDIYANANWTASAGEGLVGLAFAGDGDNGFNKFVDGLLESAKNNFKENQLSVLWAHGSDGFPHEGLGYWRKYNHVGLFFNALRREERKNDWFNLGKNYPGSEFLKNTVFPRIYAEVQHPDLACLTWGDAIAVRGKYGGVGMLSMVASEYKDGYALDFMDYLIDEAGYWFRNEDWATFIFYDDTDVPHQSFRSLPLSRYWPDMEAAIFRSSWDKDAFVFFMRSGSPGGHGRRLKGLNENLHDHLDANGFMLFYNNDYLATEDGYVPVLGPHVDSNKKFTEGHNTFLIDGEGQRGEGTTKAATTAANMDYLDADHVGYLLGDATDAYEGLDRFYRYVIYKKPEYVVILDELRDDVPHKYEFLLATDHRHRIKSEGDNKFVIAPTNGSARLLVDFAAPNSIKNSIKRDRIYSVPEKYTDMLRVWPKKNTDEAAFLSLHYPRKSSEGDPTYEKVDTGKLTGFIVNESEYFLYNKKANSYEYRDVETDARLCYFKPDEAEFEYLLSGGSELIYRGRIGITANKRLVAAFKGTSGKIRLGKNLGEEGKATIRLFYPDIDGVLIDGELADLKSRGADYVVLKLRPKQDEIGPSGYEQTVTDNYDVQILTSSSTPFVEVTNPSAGQNLQVGTRIPIQWTSDGTFTNVKIEYSDDHGASWQIVLDNAPNSGAFDWTVPNSPTAEGLVRVSESASGFPNDVNDAVFTIVKTTSELQQPGITTFSPSSGAIGSMVTISGRQFAEAGQVQINGTNATFTILSDSVITVLVPLSANSGKIGITNAAGTGISNDDFMITQLGERLTILPKSDTYVRSSKPSETFGSKSTLEVRKKSSSEYRSYLKFTMPTGTQFQNAVLRLFVDNKSKIGGELYQVSNSYHETVVSWDEDGLNWENAPRITAPPVAAVGPVSQGDWVEFDVSQADAENGELSFAILTTSSDRVEYDSKENDNPPQLVISMDSAAVQPPTITSFSPLSGETGSHVTVHGDNMLDLTSVAFDGVAAEFSAVSHSQVLATVPENASSGKIEIASESDTAVSTDRFVVVSEPPKATVPTIIGLSPDNGSVATSVAISGGHFDRVTIVTFNSVEAEFSIRSDSEIQAIVPDGATTGRVVVTSPAGASTSEVEFAVTQVEESFTLFPKSDTYVRSSKPSETFGGKSTLEVRKKSSSEYRSYLKFTVPNGTSFQGAVLRLFVDNESKIGGELYQVSNYYHETSVAWDEEGLNWENAPRIDGPPLVAIGPVGRGDWVEFGALRAVPETGEVSFAILTTSSDRVEYESKEKDNPPQLIISTDSAPAQSPTITSFSPNQGGAGTQVTIRGENLIGTTRVAFDGMAAEFGGVSESQVLAIVPINASSGQIGITTFRGTVVSGDSFDVDVEPPSEDVPTITGFSPDSGPVGTSVVITGSHFSGATSVTFNSVEAQFSIESDSEIKAIVPQGATGGMISVSGPGGGRNSEADFNVEQESEEEPKTLSFLPVEDTFVREGKPDNNYGASEELRVRKASQLQIAFLTFEVEGLNGEVTKATLLLFCTDSSDDGGTVHEVSSDWSEGKLDWKNAPELNAKVLASAGSVKDGKTVELDIAKAIKGDGLYGFAIQNSSSDVVMYSSKEGQQSPRLVVTTSGKNLLAKTAQLPDEPTSHEGVNPPAISLPSELNLLPNFPNPFNQGTRFTYSLPEAADVELTIYNMRGRHVTTLVHTHMPEGVHTLLWDGRNQYKQDVSSGAYLVRLRVQGRLLNQKIILLK